MQGRWVQGLLVLVALSGCGAPVDAGHDLALPADLGDGCNDLLDDGVDGGVCLLEVSGRLVDEAGAALDGIPVSVCGAACFYGRSTADGTFTVKVKSHLTYALYALHVDGRPDRVTYYAELASGTSQNSRVSFPGPLAVPLLPDHGPSLALDSSAQVATSGDVELTVAAGTKIELDVQDFAALPLGGELRVAAVTDFGKLPFVDAARPPAALYAFAPSEAQLSAPGGLSIANHLGLAAGAPVAVWAQHGLINATPPAGPLVRVATAHVSSDGSRIVTDATEGLGSLTWVALFPGP